MNYIESFAQFLAPRSLIKFKDARKFHYVYSFKEMILLTSYKPPGCKRLERKRYYKPKLTQFTNSLPYHPNPNTP